MVQVRPERTIYWRVLTPLMLAVLTLVAISVGGFHVLSGARAYVGGESLWSKASARAVALLRTHAVEVAAPARCAVDDWLSIPLGDRDARLALELPTPDLDTARAGFSRGGNAPEDVDAMIQLYRYGARSPLLRDSVDAWRRADRLIDEMRTLAERICREAPGTGDAEARAQNLRALDRLDADLRVFEQRFSDALGAASRGAERLLSATVAALALLLGGGCTWIVTHSLRAQIAQRDALQDANTRWELAANAAGIGVFVWHPGDDGVEVDRRARRLFGLPEDGRTTFSRGEMAAMIHPDDRDTADARSRSAAAGLPLHNRYRARIDGVERHLEAIGIVRNPEAPLDQREMFGVVRDITDEVQSTQLQLERDAAERTARARSEFLSRLSHELRTPLNAVLGLAQVMELDPGDPLSPQQRQRIALVLQSGWHLLRLVDDVLDISSIDAGTLRVSAVVTDLRAVLRASLALIEPERASSGVRVIDELPPAPAPVLADPQRLQQVFVNLLSNACKFNQPGGTLTLGHRESEGEVAVTFTDQGRGMNAAEQAELFQPFKRLAPAARVPGSGLGLVVVKRLAEQMGGRVEVNSEPGRGTRFSLWLAKA